MTYELATIFSLSIGIGAIIGLIRFEKINPAYYPFLYCIWIAFFNEVLSYYITRKGGSNGINNNIYALTESILIVWFFKNMNLFRNVKWLFGVILSSFILVWAGEIIFGKGINQTTSYFRIFYSFVVVIMSGIMLNMQLFRERKNILKNAIFLICLAFLIYYTYKIIVTVFVLYATKEAKTSPFAINLFTILIYINLFINLVYAIAVLWMPSKHRFSLPS